MPVLYEPPPLPIEDQEFEQFIRTMYALRRSRIPADKEFLAGLVQMARIRHGSIPLAKLTRPRSLLRLAINSIGGRR